MGAEPRRRRLLPGRTRERDLQEPAVRTARLRLPRHYGRRSRQQRAALGEREDAGREPAPRPTPVAIGPSMSMTTRSRAATTKPRGQVLVLFALFLLMLLGISALAIDYASWLVVDRSLQNTADHAALAGASEFEDRTGGTNCAGVKCYNARAQAWTSLNDELNLGLPSTAIGVLATTNSPAAGVNSVVAGGTTYALK